MPQRPLVSRCFRLCYHCSHQCSQCLHSLCLLGTYAGQHLCLLLRLLVLHLCQVGGMLVVHLCKAVLERGGELVGLSTHVFCSHLEHSVGVLAHLLLQCNLVALLTHVLDVHIFIRPLWCISWP